MSHSDIPLSSPRSAPAPLKDVILKLCRREDLTRDEAREAFLHIMSGQATEAQIGGLLVGLAAKGTTVAEIVGAVSVMREKALRVSIPLPDPVSNASADAADATADSTAGSSEDDVTLDTCGTGGDVRGTFNISTVAALIAASAGVRVVKHGNRSASSKCGSADVLEKLGVNIDATGDALGRCLSEAKICFAFARSHHPAMRFVASARASLGVPTIFNMLGPLTNPAGAKHQLLGVFAPELTDRFAEVLRELGSTRAWVVHADDGLDELSTLGPTRISELRDGRVHTWRFDPATLGIPYARISDLQVQTADDGAAAIRRMVIAGECGPMRDIATLNAAAALVVAGRVRELEEGLSLARQVLASGQTRQTLEALVRCSQE